MAMPETSPKALLLRNVPLFAGLDDEQLEQLSSVSVKKSYPKNTVILCEGDKSDSLYIIVSGRIKVLIGDEEGKEVILSMLGPGEFFGEMALIDDHPRSANVESTEPCELIIIGKEDFKRCLGSNFEMTTYIMKGLVKRLREADKKIESLALMDVYGRVARVLLDMAEEQDGRLVITNKPTKQDIAHMIGASREMVSRVMRDLTTGGYIQVEAREIVLNELKKRFKGHHFSVK